jgi:hypothetical protein
VEIPFKPTAPWKDAVVGSEVDDTVEKRAHVALTSCVSAASPPLLTRRLCFFRSAIRRSLSGSSAANL